MGLNPNTPAWTPGSCSSGECSGDSPDRNGRAAHCVGMHYKREEGVESDDWGMLRKVWMCSDFSLNSQLKEVDQEKKLIPALSK